MESHRMHFCVWFLLSMFWKVIHFVKYISSSFFFCSVVFPYMPQFFFCIHMSMDPFPVQVNFSFDCLCYTLHMGRDHYIFL